MRTDDALLSAAMRYGMLRRGDRVLCAVSGGADSMCLLHLLNSSKDRLGIEVAAAHYEHGIRGGESVSDAEFVRRFCGERGIEFVLGRGDVPLYAREHSLGTEDAARILRYAFLEETADRLGCTRIATAHNLNDNAETVLFNLARGTGAAGLSGIPPVRGRIIRPLIETSRKDIEACLEANGIPHVEDSTNAGDMYSRNRIRHRVIPELLALNPAFAENVMRACRLIGEDDACLEAEAAEFVERHRDGDSLPRKLLVSLPKAVSGRAVRMMCPKAISACHVDAVLHAAEGTGSRHADIPGVRVTCEAGRVFFRPAQGDGDGRPAGLSGEREIIPGRTVYLPEISTYVSAEICDCPGEVNGLLTNLYLKYDEITTGLFCTSRRPGDSMRVAGRNCTKTLKQLFLEAGVPAGERGLVPVIRAGNEVAAVRGMAVAQRFRPKKGERSLHITFTQKDKTKTEEEE